jgi:cytochrome c-type biogenesis protein CcmH
MSEGRPAAVLLWIAIALLTAAAIMAVLMPLGRARAKDDGASEARRVYLQQLEELKRDRAEGRIGAEEAESARAEIARRLIADDARAPETASENARARRATAVAALVGIPVLSLTLYLGLGAPALPGRPLAARLADPAATDDIEVLVRKVEDHLATSPEDGRGWDVIAPVYLRMGRAQEAATAYRNAIRLVGSSVERETGLGQAILAVEGGIVTAEARAAFEAANKAAPAAPGPRFFLALAAEQEGKAEAAADGYRALLAEAPADASWRPAVEEALGRVSGPGSSGPTDEQVAAAENMSATDRGTMIEGMVEGLAARLKDEPDDVEGWLRLIRSYSVLGRSEDAANAAREALAGVREDADRQRVEALIAELGVTPSGAATP